MNESTLTELKVVVERAVRPLRASLAQKRRMREELLGHLLSTFDEEAAKLGNEQAALNQAKQRFGDPRELVADLQKSVPRTDWLVRLGESDTLFGFRTGPGETQLGRAARNALFISLLSPMMISLSIPVLGLRGRAGEIVPIARALAMCGVVMAAFAFFFTLLVYGMRLALFDQSRGRRLTWAAWYALLSVVLPPLLGVLLYSGATGHIVFGYPQFNVLCYLSLLNPLVLIATACGVHNEIRYREAWAKLEIDP